MIIKPLKPTLELLQIEALNMRLPQKHIRKEEVSLKSRNLRAGYNGELSLQFPLSFLPENKYFIFHNLRMKDPQGAFQIDILLISAHFLLIIEVKNIWKHVIFDEMGQAYRIIDDEIEQGFTNPVNQVKLQHLRLRHWLKKHPFPSLPIEKVVVYSNPGTILKNLTKRNELPKIVMHKDKLLDKIDEFSHRHTHAGLSEEQRLELSHQLLSAHTEKKVDILSEYHVTYEQLIKGVICPDCFNAPMHRKGGKWLCSNCGSTSKTAHKTALAHYALLFNNYINNRQAREFLQLESSNVTKQLLQKEKLKHFGTKSGRKYVLDVEVLI